MPEQPRPVPYRPVQDGPVSLGVAGPMRPAFFPVEAPPPQEGQLRVETVATGLSAGTELTFVRGTNTHHVARWDRGRRAFTAGAPRSTYPVTAMGYMEVGRVTASRVAGVAEGDLLAMTYGHRTAATATAGEHAWFPLPGDLDPLLGVYVAQMGPIAVNGLLHAAYEVGGRGPAGVGDGVRDRSVLVTGAGVVGLLCALLAQQGGAARVAVVDASPERLDVARALGLDVMDDADGLAWQRCTDEWDGGADLVLQCRGRTSALRTALKALRVQGAVIDLAYYVAGAGDVHLGEEFHHNGLTIRCAQIGNVPPGYAERWDRAALAAATVDLLRARGADLLEHLVTDVVPLADGPRVLVELAEHRRASVQTVFVP